MKRFLRRFAALHLTLLCSVWAQPADAPNPSAQEVEEAELHYSVRDRHAVGEDIVVRTNEVIGNLVLFGGSLDVQGMVDGDVVMIGGSVTVSGEVTGGVVVIGGRLEVSGNIGRDTVVVLGGANIRDKAELEGSAVLIGGPFEFAGESQILGEKVTIPLGNILPKIEWVKEWVVQGLFLGRLLPFGVTWAWTVAGFALLFYLLVLVLFPAAVKSSYIALEQRPIASLVAGLLTLILFAPLVVVLAITVVGIAAIPFVKIALLLAIIVGKVAVICFLGRAVGRAMGGGALQAPFLAFVGGAILLTLVYTIPVIGLTAWAVGTLLGLGAAVVALGNSLSREENRASDVSVPLATLQPEIVPAGGGNSAHPETVALAFQPPLTSASLSPADTLLLRRAGFWRRFLAALLDMILLGLLIPVIGPFIIPIAVVYFVAMWTWKGTTVGSIVMGLKLIRTDGRPVNFAVALVRSLSSIFSAFVLFLGFLWAAWDREKQTWHDKIAGTIVVRMPKDFALI
jgi:uncharacterized RDD family membrane protein YckC/cytoskeletal protein CcmA (bactofilin family)